MLVCAQTTQHKDLRGGLLGTEKGRRKYSKKGGGGGSVWEVVLVTAEDSACSFDGLGADTSPYVPELLPLTSD